MDIDLEIEADEIAYIYLGTDKHNNLKNLDLPDSHPIRAITGLQEVVDKVGRTEDGAEVNEIVGVRVNGVPLDIAEDRTVDVPVPTSYGYYLDLDGSNGVISLKDRNGVVLSTIDTNLERIVESGRYDADTNELVLVLDDNTEIRIDASKLVDVYTADGETIVESGHVFALSKGSKDALKHSADHIADRSNPHNVTKDQVGLGNVDNTSDMSKPISTLVQQALDGKADDSAVVHKTGDETIGGVKTFSSATHVLGNMYIDAGNEAGVIINRTDKGIEDGWARYMWHRALDKDGKTVGEVLTTRDLTGAGTAIKADYYDSDGNRIEAGLGVTNKGTETYGYAPSWKVGTVENTNKIVTMEMANSLPTLVHTTGNEEIAGTKTFSVPIIDPRKMVTRISTPNSGSSEIPYYKIAEFSWDKNSSYHSYIVVLKVNSTWGTNSNSEAKYAIKIATTTGAVVSRIVVSRMNDSYDESGQLTTDKIKVYYDPTNFKAEIWFYEPNNQKGNIISLDQIGDRFANYMSSFKMYDNPTGVASAHTDGDGWVLAECNDLAGIAEKSTPIDAVGKEIVTADWALAKIAELTARIEALEGAR